MLVLNLISSYILEVVTHEPLHLVFVHDIRLCSPNHTQSQNNDDYRLIPSMSLMTTAI